MPTPQENPFSTVDSRDLDHYHAQPGNWNVQATQLGRGEFRSQIRSLKFPGLTVYDNKWGAASLIRGKAPDGVLMLGSVHKRSPIVRWCGEVTNQSRFACTAGGKEIEFSVEKGVHDVVLLVDPILLADTCGESAVEALQARRGVDFDHAAGRDLVETAMTLLDAGAASSGAPAERSMGNDPRSVLLDRLERCFTSTRGAAEHPPSANVRKRAFQLAIDHVTAAGLRTSALAMANAAGVSQKTLEAVFVEQLGMTPARFLKAARLNLAHRQLSDADPELMTVTGVAMHCGFSHLGRFSAEYRQLFGERPSETLARG